MEKIIIDPSERWLILAKTGGGKTQFAKHMLRFVEKSMRVVIVDPNEMWMGKAYKGPWADRKSPGTVDMPRLVTKFDPKLRVQCFQPDINEGQEDEGLKKLCWDVFKEEDVFIYFDETEGIATANDVPDYIRAIWKKGRARNIGAWVSTQAPNGIPKLFKSQAERFFVFRVGNEDIDFAASVAHVEFNDLYNIPKYHFYYYCNDMLEGVLMPPVPYEEKR